MTATSRRRRLGYGLIAYGASGLALVVAAAGLFLASLGSINAAASGFEQQRTELLSMIDPAASSLNDAADAAAHAGTSLTAASDASRRAADLTSRLATSFDAMAGLGSLDILGTRPFAGAASQFADVAAQSRELSANLASTADALTTNVTDSQRVSDDLRSLAARLVALETSVQSGTGVGTSTGIPIAVAELVVVALLAWLAVPAIASLWLGRRLTRRG